MEAIATGAAGNLVATFFATLIPLINGLIRSAENVKKMRSELQSVKMLIDELQVRVNAQQERIVPKPVEEWLGRMKDTLQTAQLILDDYHRHQRHPRWLRWIIPVLFRRKLNRRIRHWKARIQQLLAQGNSYFSVISTAQQVLSTASQYTRPLVQPVPPSGYVGTAIQSAQSTLESWLISDDSIRVVAVYGTGGVGKTSLLKMIHNSNQVNKAFEVVIWTTVSKEVSIADIQSRIANGIGLHLPHAVDMDSRKMKLHQALSTRRFLLILDDTWRRLDLEEVGVPSHTIGSKIALSSRDQRVCCSMGANRELKMGFLSDEEGWELFCRHSFGYDRSVLTQREIEVVAHEIARECKGLPLALKVVGAALANQPDVSEWDLALRQMKSVDTTFYETHPDIERDLFQPLKWSYDALPKSLRICFLYAAAYPEDIDILANELIALWTAVGAVKDGDEDIGRNFLKILRDRSLLDVSQMPLSPEMIKVHDVLRDLAIYIGEKEESCYFRAGQNVENFPFEEDTKVGCKSISLMCNDICSLPINFKCPTLTTLLLARNSQLRIVPKTFLRGLQSLKVLDLSFTSIESLPESLGQLKNLVSLQLRGILIQQLPETTCSLDKLQILNLSRCQRLQSLPPKIGELRRLRSLDLSGCLRLNCLASGILQLTDLKRLCIWPMSPVTGGAMGRWTKMEKLWMNFQHTHQSPVPEDMRAMEKLQRLTLESCRGVTRLPDYICEYQYLSELRLLGCKDLTEIPPQLHRLPRLRKLEITINKWIKELGEGFGNGNGFPMLEELCLGEMRSLESLVGRCSDGCDGVMEEGAMPLLRSLIVYRCVKLHRLPVGMDKLRRLEQIQGDLLWWNEIIWKDQNMKYRLQRKYFGLSRSN